MFDHTKYDGNLAYSKLLNPVPQVVDYPLESYYFFLLPFRPRVPDIPDKKNPGTVRYKVLIHYERNELETSKQYAHIFVEHAKVITKNDKLKYEEKDLGGNTTITFLVVDLSKDEKEALEKHDAEVYEKFLKKQEEQIKLAAIQEKQAKFAEIPILQRGRLETLKNFIKSLPVGNGVSYQPAVDALQHLCDYMSQQKLDYVKQDVVISEIKTSLNVAKLPNNIESAININSINAPKLQKILIFYYPLSIAKEYLTDHRSGNADIAVSKNTFDLQALNSLLLKFSANPVEQLRFIELMHNVIIDNYNSLYTYTGIFKGSKKLPLTGTQQKHISLLKAATVEIARNHIENEAVKNELQLISQRRTDNIIDGNVSNWSLFQRKVTGTREKINQIQNKDNADSLLDRDNPFYVGQSH